MLSGPGADALLLDTLTLGGGAGMAFGDPCVDGSPGPDVVAPQGSVTLQPFDSRSTSADGPVRGGEVLTLTFEGGQGDLVLLAVAPAPAPLFVAPTAVAPFPLLGGSFLPDAGAAVVVVAGVIGSGPLQLAGPVGVPAAEAVTHHVQSIVVSPSALGEIVFSSAQAVTVLDPVF